MFLYYLSGRAGWGRGTSARLERIWDVRKNVSDNAYSFGWDTSGDIPHLQTITNSVGSGETFTFVPSAVE